MLRGFDVSHHQGGEDWAAMRDRYGITYGFAKGTEGELFRDSQFPANWEGMRRAGLIRGAYHFARPDADPHDDVERFLNYVDPSLPTDLLVLDLEVSTLGQDATSAWAEEWAKHCRRLAPAYVPGVYMGSGYLTNRTGAGLRGPFGWLWYPRPVASSTNWPASYLPPPPRDRNGVSVSWTKSAWGDLPEFWQCNWTFPVGGEDHDANVYNGGLDQLRALNAPAQLEEDDVRLSDHVNLTDPAPGADPRELAGQILEMDEITVDGALGYAATAVKAYELGRENNKLLRLLAAKLGVEVPA